MLSLRTFVVAASLLLAVTALGQVGPAVQEAKLTASDAAAFDFFGGSVALSEDTAVVGAYEDESYSGSAYVFVRSGTSWAEQAKLTASDAAAGDYFGNFVALSGDTAVVGAYGDDSVGGMETGAAYVFIRSGTSWSQQAKLTASDAAAGDYFGNSVALSGDTALVGAYQDDSASGIDTGSAYVFVRSGTSWAEQAKLTASDAAPLDYFGYSVELSGDTAVVGVTQIYGAAVGAAYVFVRSGTSWSQQAKLTASDAAGDYFGYSVALSGDTAVVGAYRNDAALGVETGSAYVFVRIGTSWSQQAKLIASDVTSYDYLGYSVALSGDTAVVGAFGDNSFSGSAYVFVRSGTNWSQQAKLTASDGAAQDRFGASVALSGDTAVAGATYGDSASGKDTGSAYVFRLVTGTWSSLGLGLAGTTGAPVLTGAGFLLEGSPVTLSLAQAKPFSLAPLVAGLSNFSAAFKGGVMVPYPNYIFPLFTDFFGKSSFGGLWPPGVPAGFTTYFQWWIQDSAGPQGFAASNAVAGTAP